MQRGTARAWFELLSSMRFAISLLTVLAIASVVGTVVKQNEPFNAYLNQFGPFWFPVFETLGIYSVYNAGWFLVILAFLVLSTSLCIVRQTRPMLREMRHFREHAREASLRQFGHQASLESAADPATTLERARSYLAGAGLRFRASTREDGVLLAAKQGSAGRAGYFLAHGAIVLICIGGLLDGDLPLKLEMAIGGKQATSGNQLIADIPESARLAAENPSFRGNVFIPEGRSASIAVLNVGDGILLQELPFTISLKRFHIDHYENGMPRRFASDILITDATGTALERTIEVNRPLEYRGITLYQSSFEDGGSILSLAVRGLARGVPGLTSLQGAVGDTLPLAAGDARYTLELTQFRAFNVEDMGAGDDDAAARAQGMARIEQHLGSGAKTPTRKNLRNVGPTYTFKLRDEAGQAREFHNYMLPIEQNGRWYLYSGTRDSQADSFRYIRFPLDNDGKLETWFAVREIMFDPARRAEIAHRFAARNAGAESAADAAGLRERLAQTAEHTLTLFADRGYESVGRFIESTVPQAERERAAEVFVRILQGVAWEAWLLARERNSEAAPQFNESHAAFLRDSIAALSDSLFYGAPVYLQLTAYDERQATVLQATRSPGKPLVFLGSLLLVLGVFAMLYIRERRLFLLLKADEVLVAMSSNRKTIDVDETFQRHVDGLREALAAPDFHPTSSRDA